MKDKKELKLVEKLKKGDKRAFESFYNSTYQGLLGYVLLRVKLSKDAEEIVHDSYLSFLDSLPLFLGKSSLKTFLGGIARHEIADYWRKKYAKKAILIVPFMDQVYTEKIYSALVMSHEIERVYAMLADDYVLILRLKYEEEMTLVQIAKKMRLGFKATESKLFRARKAFQEAYINIYGQK